MFEYFALSWFGYSESCVSCDTEISVYTTDNLGIAEIEIEISDSRKKTTIQTIINPVPSESLTGITKWLYEIAKERGFDSVEKK